MDYPLIHWCEQYVSDGFIELYDTGYHKILSKCGPCYPFTQLDKPLDDYDLTVDFIKLETNGTELEILQGMINTIKTNEPAILFNNPLLIPKLKELGYQIYPVNGRSYWLANDYNTIGKIPYKLKWRLDCPMSPYRVPNNPSIINIPGGYLCNMRCSNYVYDPHFRFLEGTIHLSDHVLLWLNQDFLITKSVQLVDKTNNVYYDSFVKGIDDLRLINDHQFICSHGNFYPHRVIQ